MTAAVSGAARHAQVVHALGAAIVHGELGPGAPVPTEDELVSQFQVGRSALREGVKVLAGKGLLESRTSAGTRVRPRESWNLLDPDVLALAVRPAGQPGRRPDAGRSAGRAGARRGPAGRRAGQRGAARCDHDRDGAAVGDGRRPGSVHRGRPGLSPRGVRRLRQRPAALHPRRDQRGAQRDPAAAHPLRWRTTGRRCPHHQRVAEAIQRGHHRKAEAAMREVVEGARADALRSGGTP